MDQRIPPIIQPGLTAYTGLVERELPGVMRAFYLHGSIALGAFNPRLSDIDFITVVNRRLTARDLACLQRIHREIEAEQPQWEWEGSYLQPTDLGRFAQEIDPYPSYYDGKLHPRGYHGLNAVTWWMLKHRGIAVVGTAPHALDFAVDWDRLIGEMHENLNTYWASWAQNPTRVVKLLADYGIQWTVLGVLRQFYTFRENDITSKTGAGQYALSQVPKQWHRLIREAIRIRAGTNGSYYRSRLGRAREAVRFLQYMIASCNAHLGRIT